MGLTPLASERERESHFEINWYTKYLYGYLSFFSLLLTNCTITLWDSKGAGHATPPFLNPLSPERWAWLSKLASSHVYLTLEVLYLLNLKANMNLSVIFEPSSMHRARVAWVLDQQPETSTRSDHRVNLHVKMMSESSDLPGRIYIW